VKPGDHPNFFRLPAPEGRSRESTIRLDGEGRFFHDGAPVEHPKLAAAMHRWIRRHPHDGRWILSNGYDWTYFTVEDVPFFVVGLRVEPERVMLRLSDGSEEEWVPEESRIGPAEALYTRVKRSAPGGACEARFSRHAQAELGAVLVEVDGAPAAEIGGRVRRIGGGRA
jgi:hypothetical protein